MQSLRYFDSETVRIVYRAARLTTGLADIKIDIWNNALTKVKAAQTLTELGNGIYYYDYIPLATGNFIYRIWCDTQPHDVDGSFAAVGRNSPYWRGTGVTMGITPGAAAPSLNKELNESIKKVQATIDELVKSIMSLSSDIDKNKSAIEISSSKKKLFSAELETRVDNLANAINTVAETQNEILRFTIRAAPVEALVEVDSP